MAKSLMMSIVLAFQLRPLDNYGCAKVFEAVHHITIYIDLCSVLFGIKVFDIT